MSGTTPLLPLYAFMARRGKTFIFLNASDHRKQFVREEEV
jgi:hypothetical protein